MTPGNFAYDPLPARAAPAQARHLGVGAGLVDEDEPRRIKPSLAGLPALARHGHIRPILLGRVHGFFLA
jgi:hypothetical protein